jgi:predicted enzyme related to lactoylglutathione lyase
VHGRKGNLDAMPTARKRKSAVRVVRRGTKGNGKKKKQADPPAAPLEFGKIGWLDLTIPDAGRAREFYRKVVGWTSQGIDMGGYEDFTFHNSNGQPVAGLCNARGPNVGLPAVWLPYFTVVDVDASARNTEVLGGRVRSPVRSMEQGRFCVVEDPSGAVCALFEPKRT